MYTFSTMDRWDMTKLRKIRKELRDQLSEEIQKRQAIKAEIMWLEAEIQKYQDSEQ